MDFSPVDQMWPVILVCSHLILVWRARLFTKQRPFPEHMMSDDYNHFSERKCAARSLSRDLILQAMLPVSISLYDLLNSPVGLFHCNPFVGLLVYVLLSNYYLPYLALAEGLSTKERQFTMLNVYNNFYWMKCCRRSVSEDVILQIKSYIIWMEEQNINLKNVGTRKIEDLIGQVLLAKQMGKKKIVIGQLGNGDDNCVIAVPALCAQIGLQCTVYMDAQTKTKQRYVDARQLQFWNAKVNVINLGTPKHEYAISAAMWDWLSNFQTTYCIGASEFVEYVDPKLQLANFLLDYDDRQNFILNLPPICPRLSSMAYSFGNSVRKSVVETIVDAISELELACHSQSMDENFQKQRIEILKHYRGRDCPPYKSPIGDWPRWDLRKEFPILTGSHNIDNAVVQTLLAKVLGKKRIVVATGDGQHGYAIAGICARVGLRCVIYMDAQDIEDQRKYVLKMQLLPAEVRAVHSGTDSKSAAIWDWVTNVEITHYILGSNAIGNGAMSYLLPDDDDDEPEPYSIHARTDCLRCRYCASNVSRQDQKYHNQLYHQSVRAKLVPGVAAFTSKIATLTRNVEGFTDHFSKLCTWLSSFFEESDGLFAMLGSLSGWVYTTGLPQICAKWKNDMESLASVSEDVSKGVHVLRGVADEAARLANKEKMAIIPARVAAVRAAAARAAAARLDIGCTAAAPAATADYA